MKSTILKAVAAFMAIIMITCCFSACNIFGGGEETTTQPTNAVVPGGNQNVVNTLPPATSNVWNDTTTTTQAPTTSTTTTTQAPDTTASTTTTTTTQAPETTTSIMDLFPTDVNIEDLTAGTGESDVNPTDVLNAAGYEYDAEQQIYYSTLNPWQRHFGFGDIYDVAAAYTNMRYTTFKADFDYDGLLWRLQWWKGQYGILEGAEMGVYTRDPASDTEFYNCASDEHLLEMSFEYYRTGNDFKNDNRLFIRQEQEHWWLTGFKVGYIANNDTSGSVVKATLKAFNEEMADGIESGLRSLTDANNVRGDGFRPLTSDTPEGCYDYYIRKGNTFTVVWQKMGYKNHQTGAIEPDA